MQLTGRYFERDSDTRYLANNTTAGFAGYVVEDLGPTGRVGAAGFSYERWSVEGKASLRLDSKTRAGLEYETPYVRWGHRAIYPGSLSVLAVSLAWRLRRRLRPVSA